MSNDDLLRMGADELRAEAAALIMRRETIRRMLSDLEDRGRAVERLLAQGPNGMRMKKDEGIPTKYGVLKRHEVTKGRAWVVTDEVDKDAGELGELAPKKDHRIVVEHASDLPAAVAAELMSLSKREEDPPVKVTPKAKYPTVAQLRKAFGQDTKYVGTPPTETHIVLSIDNGEGQEPTLLGIEGNL